MLRVTDEANNQNISDTSATISIGTGPVKVPGTAGASSDISLARVAGNPAIAYFDLASTSLKYVRATDAAGTAWGPVQTLDNNGAAGQFCSMATHAAGHLPAIACYRNISATDGDRMFIESLDSVGGTWGAPVTLVGQGDA